MKWESIGLVSKNRVIDSAKCLVPNFSLTLWKYEKGPQNVECKQVYQKEKVNGWEEKKWN